MVRKKITSIFLVLMFFLEYSLPIYAVEKKPTIAVYELKALGVDGDMATTLTDVLRDAIFQTGKFEMLTKKDMERILSNLAEKQKITPDCNTDACIAEIAGALGVEKMIIGSVGKVGETYVINLRLVDAEAVQTIKTITSKCACPEDFLIENIKQVGLGLLKIKSTESEKELQEAELVRENEQAPREKQAEEERNMQELETKKAEEAREEQAELERKQQEAEAKKAEEARKNEQAQREKQAETEREKQELEAKKAEEAREKQAELERKQQEAAAKKAEEVKIKEAEKISKQKPVEETNSVIYPRRPGSTRRIVGWTALGVGIIGSGIGVSYESKAKSSYSDYLNLSNNDDAQKALVKAYSEENTAVIVYGISSCFLGIAAYCWWTMPENSPKLSRIIFPDEINISPYKKSLNFAWKF